MAVRERWPTKEVVRGYVLLPHATPIIAVMTATAMFAFIARGGWPGGVDLAMLLIAMFGGQIAVGAVNELVDVELDRESKPDKPIAAGLVSEQGARMMALAGIALMVIGSLRFSFVAFALCALGTGLGIAYSFWFKRSAWSAIPYVLAIPLIPIWVWEALETVPAVMLALYPVAVPSIVAVQIAQSVPDIKADRSVGVRTLAVALGERRATMAARILVALSAVLSAGLARTALEWPEIAVVAGAVAGGIMILDAFIWARDPDRARMLMFPLVAGAVGVLGIGWVMAAAG